MDLAVFFDGDLVGSQGFHAQDFLITRVGETGSWLGREFQGRGIGTAMRKVICAFMFDHLDAQFITSSAYTDNAASLAVSRKCGYTENGVTVMKRMDKAAPLQLLILEPANLARYDRQLTVEGLPEFRRSIGLDA
jgi:RimJ/RimL family protein N-acetyltransferase